MVDTKVSKLTWSGIYVSETPFFPEEMSEHHYLCVTLFYATDSYMYFPVA